jgi:hypothetical protein
VTTALPPAPARGALLSDTDFDAVVATVLDNNPGMSAHTAARIVEQALAFVATAAAHPGAPIAPSRIVDEGWHALILHTALYARLCERLGAFVHHYPERPDPDRQSAGVLAYTVDLMTAAGHRPDLELWPLPTAAAFPVAAQCGHAPSCGVEPDLLPA